MEAKKLVGWNLRRLRVAKNLTIEELAGRADVDSSYFGRLEATTPITGRPSAKSRATEAKLNLETVVVPLRRRSRFKDSTACSPRLLEERNKDERDAAYLQVSTTSAKFGCIGRGFSCPVNVTPFPVRS
jgi:transcriptional regulator with XRE-family HTH domain